MPLFWASLALAILLSTYGAVVVFRHGRALWRDFTRTAETLAAMLDEVSRKAEVAAARAEALDAVGTRIEPETERLRTSLAKLAVLRAAVGDVQYAVGRVTAVYPRK